MEKNKPIRKITLNEFVNNRCVGAGTMCIYYKKILGLRYCGLGTCKREV